MIFLALVAFVVSLFRPAGIFDISVYAFSGYTLIVAGDGFWSLLETIDCGGSVSGKYCRAWFIGCLLPGFQIFYLGNLPRSLVPDY